MNQNERRLFLIRSLLNERLEYRDWRIPQDVSDQKLLLRGLLNVRPAQVCNPEFLRVQDAYLRQATAEKGMTDCSALSPVQTGLYLWQGDITTLKCGAVVNAANSGMTGCYQPCHNCIDNCIHTFSGVRLRLECADIMQKQGFEEPVGQAKLTFAYNLPCDHIIHTVGPAVQGELTDKHCEMLKSCYSSCLEIAVENHIGSIAFCCISTGVFGFPKQEAAEIA